MCQIGCPAPDGSRQRDIAAVTVYRDLCILDVAPTVLAGDPPVPHPPIDSQCQDVYVEFVQLALNAPPNPAEGYWTRNLRRLESSRQLLIELDTGAMDTRSQQEGFG